jgi:phosphate transport system permease protein
MAVQSDAMEATGPYDRAKALNAFKLGDVTFYWITRACAISVLLILGGIILSLVVGAWPAMRQYGAAFLWTQRWAPSADPPVLGALGPMYGTLVTSFIAMLIAIPVGLGIAIFLTELCPQWLRRPIGIAIELLAGIPSIIYGMWGFFVLGPFLAYTFQPFMISLFDGVPLLGSVFAGPPSYLSLFNAALILSIMVLPFITAISVDVFKTVPGSGSSAASCWRSAARSAKPWRSPSSSEIPSASRRRSLRRAPPYRRQSPANSPKATACINRASSCLACCCSC